MAFVYCSLVKQWPSVRVKILWCIIIIMPSRSVANCNYYTRKAKGTDIKYFRYPKNKDLAKQWIVACRRKDEIYLKHSRYLPTAYYSKYFTPKCDCRIIYIAHFEVISIVVLEGQPCWRSNQDKVCSTSPFMCQRYRDYINRHTTAKKSLFDHFSLSPISISIKNLVGSIILMYTFLVFWYYLLY